MSIITLTTTVGASSSNSYVTLAEAVSFAKNRIDGDYFLNLKEQQQNKLLVSAADNMQLLTYRATKYYTDQALDFPRSYTPDASLEDYITNSSIEIPDCVKDAQVLEAIALAKGLRPQSGGVSIINGSTVRNASQTLASREALLLLTKKGWVVSPPNLTVSLGVF